MRDRRRLWVVILLVLLTRCGLVLLTLRTDSGSRFLGYPAWVTGAGTAFAVTSSPLAANRQSSDHALVTTWRCADPVGRRAALALTRARSARR